MKDNRFWRCAVAAAIVSVFYLGYSFQSRNVDPFPTLVNTARADGIAISPVNTTTALTVNPSGDTVYLWSFDGGSVRYKGVAIAAAPGANRDATK